MNKVLIKITDKTEFDWVKDLIKEAFTAGVKEARRKTKIYPDAEYIDGSSTSGEKFVAEAEREFAVKDQARKFKLLIKSIND